MIIDAVQDREDLPAREFIDLLWKGNRQIRKRTQS